MKQGNKNDEKAVTPAFVRLMTDAQFALFSYILLLVGDSSDARDVLQDTNLTILRNASHYRPGTLFIAWAKTLAHYQVLTYRKKKSRDRLVFDDEVFLRLAVVAGAYGGIRVDPDPASTAWPKVKENAVIPYDSGWAEATYGAATSRLVIAKQNGLTQTNVLVSSGGYFGWKLKQSQWGYGTFNLALAFPGTVTNEWEAALARVPEGFLFGVR